jgi:hypothetical protein
VVSHTLRMLLFTGIAGVLAGLALVEARPVRDEPWRCADPTRAGAERVVFLTDDLPDEDRIAFTTALAAGGHPGVVLFDSERSRASNKAFLEQFRPRQVISVPSFAPANELWKSLLPQARTMVVAPAQPRGLLLQAACLAGALHAPLFISHEETSEVAHLQRGLKDWPIQEIYAVGKTHTLCAQAGKARVRKLRDEEAVAAAYLAICRKQGPVATLVVANPADIGSGTGMSALAPWLAMQKRALLLLTNSAGDNVESLVAAAVSHPGVEQADSLILLGDLRALPMQRRPNPLPGGKDDYIEMEPMTPEGDAPHSFAVGRLFHQDPGMVALMLARSRLLYASTSPPKALVASNPGGGLPLLESFSRNTARELANAGYDTTGLFEDKVNREDLRRLLPQQNIFLWEGHYSTLVRSYQVHQWSEPLRPSLVFLQSCLALSEDKSLPFLERGACAVIGTSTRTYSASGGAFALAYFNALLYEHQSLGGSLRQAKNFLQAFARLKEKRLGDHSKLGGANIRTSWAFTLWGDPTLRFPEPPLPPAAVPRVKHQVQGNTIRISVPDVPHEKSSVGRYETEIWANSRIGGLLRTRDAGSKQLVPLVFTEIHLPQVPPAKTPVLSSRLPGRNWVFGWDARRRCGYLLAAPRARDAELLFRVLWD